MATRYAEEDPFLGTLAGRPPYDTAYHTLRRVGRDGWVSYRRQTYQVPLAHAVTTIEVIEPLGGALRDTCAPPITPDLWYAAQR